jgi:DNA-binding TFAR19-related protein (PDSD5 family)
MFLHLSDFGRLAKRYEAVRNAKLEELKRKYPYAGERRRENTERNGHQRVQEVCEEA